MSDGVDLSTSTDMMGGVRWAFRCGSWTPTRGEWLYAARCVQLEEKERIGQFVFAKDAKSAMAGRLLLRRLVCERMGVPWSEIRLERSPKGKPYLAAPACSGPEAWGWSFNVSHQGDYAVLAAEQGRQVGVDVMKTAMPGSSSVQEFFRIMKRQFTEFEWTVIRGPGPERSQLAMFYRHWALKESFIKAIGTGLGFNLQRVEFRLSSEPITAGQVHRGTRMHLDEEEEEGDSSGPGSPRCCGPGPPHTDRVAPPTSPPPSFKLLTFSDLISLATPLSKEDTDYWDNFQRKRESPERRRDTHL